jgi:hypothetical protein
VRSPALSVDLGLDGLSALISAGWAQDVPGGKQVSPTDDSAKLVLVVGDPSDRM